MSHTFRSVPSTGTGTLGDTTHVAVGKLGPKSSYVRAHNPRYWVTRPRASGSSRVPRRATALVAESTDDS